MAGIAVKMLSPGRPSIRLVVVTETPAIAVETSEVFSSDHADLAEQLHDTAEAIRSRLVGLGVDRVFVRRADRAPVPSSQEGPRIRLLTEGAIVSAARSVVVDTHVGTGKDAAGWHGSKKAQLDDAASALASAHGLNGTIYAEAVGAGLAALSI